MNMKDLFRTMFIAVTTVAATSVSAQSRTTDARLRASRQQADTVVISQQADGPYTVRRILVRGNSPQKSQYDVHYAINRSDIERDIDNNAEQLNEIAGYIDPRTGDTLCYVECIKVHGYASPDGSDGMNRTLAAARARKFAAYLNRLCGASKSYDVTVDSKVLPWSSCRAAVASSSMPDRTAVLAIIDGNMTDAEKQVRLKRMPEAWTYLAKNVLPPLRRVDVELDYDRDRIVTVRELTNPKPEIVVVEMTEQHPECPPAQSCGDCCSDTSCCCDEEYDGLMIEYFGCPDE